MFLRVPERCLGADLTDFPKFPFCSGESATKRQVGLLLQPYLAALQLGFKGLAWLCNAKASSPIFFDFFFFRAALPD